MDVTPELRWMAERLAESCHRAVGCPHGHCPLAVRVRLKLCKSITPEQWLRTVEVRVNEQVDR